jgi:hypothetical protein
MQNAACSVHSSAGAKAHSPSSCLRRRAATSGAMPPTLRCARLPLRPLRATEAESPSPPTPCVAALAPPSVAPSPSPSLLSSSSSSLLLPLLLLASSSSASPSSSTTKSSSCSRRQRRDERSQLGATSGQRPAPKGHMPRSQQPASCPVSPATASPRRLRSPGRALGTAAASGHRAVAPPWLRAPPIRRACADLSGGWRAGHGTAQPACRCELPARAAF